jgi:hypothetical protein
MSMTHHKTACSLPGVTGRLTRAVLIELGCIIASAFLCAPPTALGADATSAQSAQAPLAEDETAVYAVAKVRQEQKRVVEDIAFAKSRVETLKQRRDDLDSATQEIDHQARIYDDSPESVQGARDAEDYKARCAGKQLYGSDISRCESLYNSIAPRMAAHNQKMQEYFERVRAGQASVQQANNELVLAQARVQKLTIYLSWLTSTETTIDHALESACGAWAFGRSLEELKHRCGNIQFDGADLKLEPCNDELCVPINQFFRSRSVVSRTPTRTPEQAIEEYKKSGPANPGPKMKDGQIAVPAPGSTSH